MWCCGKNTDGELGFGNEQSCNIPKNVQQLRGFPVKDFAASGCHTVLVSSRGDVHVAGSTLHGKMGLEGIQKKNLNKFHVITQMEGHKV